MDTAESTNQRNTGNVIGGHKANLSNPNTSEESKQHSKEVLEQLGDSKSASKDEGEADLGGKDPGNVKRGYKATLSNPNVSDEAKEHAKEVLESMGEKTS